jgi:predicted aminopeptidase
MSGKFLYLQNARFFPPASRLVGSAAGCAACNLALLAIAATVLLGGCTAAGYYAQAVQGHFKLLAAARPIPDWLDDPTTPPHLKERLELARRIRGYASRVLGLPDNRSYTAYADLKRPAAVWNVFATPELSLELKRWCYPLFGCAGYRGYFDQAAAQALAVTLRAQGDDVEVGPVPAYSTLGWFPDPLLNTFIDWPDGELARLVFHELAHQVLYVKDDTVFNESFATTVERAGVQRWLATESDDPARRAYAQVELRRTDFVALLLDYRRRLAAVYAGGGTEMARRQAKRDLLDALRQEYQRLRRERWDGFSGYERFFGADLNGARLAAVGAYNDLVPAFERLLASVDGDLPSFYQQVRRLAEMPKPERDRALGLPSGSVPPG